MTSCQYTAIATGLPVDRVGCRRRGPELQQVAVPLGLAVEPGVAFAAGVHLFRAFAGRLGLVHLEREPDVAGVQPGAQEEGPTHGGATQPVPLPGEARRHVAVNGLPALGVDVTLSIVDVEIALHHASHAGHDGRGHRQFSFITLVRYPAGADGQDRRDRHVLGERGHRCPRSALETACAEPVGSRSGTGSGRTGVVDPDLLDAVVSTVRAAAQTTIAPEVKSHYFPLRVGHRGAAGSPVWIRPVTPGGGARRPGVGLRLNASAARVEQSEHSPDHRRDEQGARVPLCARIVPVVHLVKTA
ncbi:hypothetical protein [Amycolatopsis sp. FDAARGOS 1241]|uniref:hypothetical protein n=1 Tax=Amycolatopsis sp. FDAARGOS 1241 TaxID=2778070 RepID=UPI001EF3A337|nr:hypothetical protein [Amycolatopsis sp. FDAARGOS 1241]